LDLQECKVQQGSLGQKELLDVEDLLELRDLLDLVQQVQQEQLAQ
jgi:hypothetical protein